MCADSTKAKKGVGVGGIDTVSAPNKTWQVHAKAGNFFLLFFTLKGGGVKGAVEDDCQGMEEYERLRERRAQE